jgi:hypothetical protein
MKQEDIYRMAREYYHNERCSEVVYKDVLWTKKREEIIR